MIKLITALAFSLLFTIFIQAKEQTNKNFTGPGTYKILKNDNQPIKISFEMVNGKPVMDLEINGKPARMMIDNGVLWDQVWLFGSPLVKELGLKSIHEGEIGGSGEGDPTAAFTSDPLTMKFEDIVFHEQPVLVSPPTAGFAQMFPGADGQLCNTFFKHFIVEFDFVKYYVILHDPKSFKYNGKGSILDMQENGLLTFTILQEYLPQIIEGLNKQSKIKFGKVKFDVASALKKQNIALQLDSRKVRGMF